MKAWVAVRDEVFVISIWISALFAVCLMVLGALGCTKHSPLATSNLPDTLPACSPLYHWRVFPLLRSGPFGDRAIICLQKEDGNFAWFETPFEEVK